MELILENSRAKKTDEKGKLNQRPFQFLREWVHNVGLATESAAFNDSETVWVEFDKRKTYYPKCLFYPRATDFSIRLFSDF